jgi:uncharacterized protein
MPRKPSLADLRRAAIAHSLGLASPPSTLAKAIARLGFVQADPIRAPARAQDLTLRHRVANYRAGDLEAKYTKLDIEEDFFVNYGFVTRSVYACMHPRIVSTSRDAMVKKHGANVLAFVREKGVVHPREVDAAFAHGNTRNAWGGQSKLTTHLLDGMHYRGMLRVASRDNGIRLYALPAHEPVGRPKSQRQSQSQSQSEGERDAKLDHLIDVLMAKYAPLPQRSVQPLLGRLRFAVPHWRGAFKRAIDRAKTRWHHAEIDGTIWVWPDALRVDVGRDELDERVRLLAPFDPVVWDRHRFELFWGWAYRFEAYVPAAKRKLGYYALPMLWRDQVIGWANAKVSPDEGELRVDIGYVNARAPRARAFRAELDDEISRLSMFLRVPASRR